MLSPIVNQEHGRPLAPKKTATLAASCVRAVNEARTALHQNGLPADRYLVNFFRANHQFGSRDRHAITESVFSFFRWYGCLKLVFDLNNFSNTPEMAIAAALCADHAAVPVAAHWLGDTDELPEDSFERIRIVSKSNRMLSPRDLVPDWMQEEIAPELLTPWLTALQTRPYVWLRAQNTTAEQLVSLLKKYEVEAEEFPSLQGAVKLKNRNIKLGGLPAALQRYFEVQDLSSQCIAAPAQPKAGEVWWDVCAGAGGKTMQLASTSNGKAEILATDIRENILEEIKRRAKQGGFRTIRVANAAQVPKQKLFDGILTDVPCSSSGRWRRNPEARWIFTKEKLDELNRTQYQILCRASEQVKPGGRLIYGTCSIFRCENQEIIRKFLTGHPKFELAAFPAPLNPEVITDGMYTAMAEPAGCDFSFCAMMKRKS